MKNIFNKKAFTLLEVIIVIYIFSMGILGLSTLVIKNIQLENMNKNGLIASQLAQEGLELVRNQRDSNWLNTGADWFYNVLGDGTYGIDATNNIVNYSGINEAVLKINSEGVYNLSDGVDTKFKRLITASNNGDNISVSCLVQWSERGKDYQYQADTILYNWK